MAADTRDCRCMLKVQGWCHNALRVLAMCVVRWRAYLFLFGYVAPYVCVAQCTAHKGAMRMRVAATGMLCSCYLFLFGYVVAYVCE